MRSSNDTEKEARNKKLVLDMWQAVIVDYSPDAVLRYIAPHYIQHNPAVPPGRAFLYEAVKAHAERVKADPNTPPHTTKRLIHAFADGDLVALVWALDVPEPSDPSRTYVASAFDMFRVQDGMIVEHWDDVRKGA
jgi:predicted SnoaL-like aldol condensation-catalyzing enzyme